MTVSLNRNIQQRRLLVTGGAGFIGANFVHYWSQNFPHHTICVLDKLTYAGNLNSINDLITGGKINFVEGDIQDQLLVEQLIEQYGIDTIVHFAAESHVDNSIDNPSEFIQTNVVGTHSLLNATKTCLLDKGKPHHFHHISTDEVFGELNLEEPGFNEQHPYQPNSPYSASKAAADHIVRAYHQTYGLNVTISNCSNNFGRFHHVEKLIPKVITNILQNKPLPIYGKGQQIRDWLFVLDHVRQIEQILASGKMGESYNLGGNNEVTNIDLVNFICQIIDELFVTDKQWQSTYANALAAIKGDSAELITFVDDRFGHDFRYAIDTTKFAAQFDHQVQPFRAALKETIVWYLKNPNWWTEIR